MKAEQAITEIIKLRTDDFNTKKQEPSTGRSRQYEIEEHNRLIKTLEGARAGVPSFVKFVETCTIQIEKPRVYKSKRGGHYNFMHRGLYIKPMITLVTDGRKIEVENKEFLSTTSIDRYAGGKQVPRDQIPWLASRHFNIYASSYSFNMDDVLIRALMEDCGDSIKRIHEAICKEYDDVESKLDSIVNEHRDRHGERDRKKLQEKLATTLRRTQGLIEADPASVLAVFKLGWKEIEILMKYAKKNKHEVDLAELEDIQEAQNIAKIGGVMES